MSRKVACLGILVADLVARTVESMPERGKLRTVDQMSLHTGGCAANTAIALAKLGARTLAIGATGDDPLGAFLAGELASQGVDVRGVRKLRDCSTSATMVLVHRDGERSFLHHLGANAHFRPADVDFRLVEECAYLHLAGALILPGLDGQPMAEVLARARSKGVTTSLDTAWDPSGRWLETLEPCLPHLDYFMPSLEEARELSRLDDPEKMLAFFAALGSGTVILKMGVSGSMALDASGIARAPAIPTVAVDATGAGDCFAAGFLRGRMEGWAVERCLRLGNAAGSLCVRAVGATSGIRSFEDTVSLI